MSFLDVANVLVFFLGCYVVVRGFRILLRNNDTLTTKVSNRIIAVFVLENLLDECATLIFSIQTVLLTLLGMEGNPNAISPWLDITLRVIIFGGSHFAMIKAEDVALQDLNQIKKIKENIECVAEDVKKIIVEIENEEEKKL